MKTISKLWIGLGVLAIASPLGLYLPNTFKAGEAWGEWSGSTIGRIVGYIPKGLAGLSSLWNAPLPGYAFRGMEHAGLGRLSLAYIFSALLGIALCVAAGFAAGKLLSRKRSTVAKKT